MLRSTGRAQSLGKVLPQDFTHNEGGLIKDDQWWPVFLGSDDENPRSAFLKHPTVTMKHCGKGVRSKEMY